jgi:N6-L-threonylcarbamoyladenine synthase
VIVLGIESSCDETAAALVTGDGLVLTDVVASQIAEHAPYGGVVPELASRAHLRAIVPVMEEALAHEAARDLDAIAVTHGPGLVGSLVVGLQAAKAFAWSKKLPLVGVNHLEAHLFSCFLRREERDPVPSFPYVALLASGGHSSLYRIDDPANRDRPSIEHLGSTRDDAAGEAFDKVAKLLGLRYPGGPVIDRLAAGGDPHAIEFPLPIPDKKSFDFSFSGLKTAVAIHVRKHGLPANERALADLCASFQHIIVESLVRKSVLACEAHRVRTLVLTGGVAANRGLRARAKEACEARGIGLFVPPPSSCTDNAAMIAYRGALVRSDGRLDDLALAPFSRDTSFRRGRIRPARA